MGKLVPSLRRGTVPLVLSATAVIAAVMATNANGAEADQNGITVSWEETSPSVVAGSSPTSLGHSWLAKAEPGRTASRKSDDQTGVTSSWEVATLTDSKTGKIIVRKRYGPHTEGKRLNPVRDLKRLARGQGTGGTSTASGCIKVEIWQRRDTILGAFAAKWGVWTDWCWTRSALVLTVNNKGKDFDVAPGYSFDEVKDSDGHYYDWGVDNGHPHSAYHHHKVGGFSSPACCIFPGGHWYPKNTLDSYSNGTNLWFTSD